eukprot:CAMPEP_0172481200 /NCGR_PEP_ID=MMETSP1066-20121228/6866_1 /TAXON_ID=671091 /ORGANISM="Coscinodiscus wailesii, Strain CCMP2513" /LENGTH=244 /DNA_ID=CAMNT_0013243233 /DNA_START=53 /DNA_END=787 /DNA_ORIENTATION=-
MTTLYDEDGVTLIRSSNGVNTIVLDRGENRFNPSLISGLSKAITKVEAADHPKALIITGRGKFFSNGLDLDFMNTRPRQVPSMIESTWRLLARVLVLDCRTVAAINGHAFGAGLFLALACDYRLMRTERGYLNFPEVNLGMRLAKGFAEISKAKVGKLTLREGVLTAKRYGSREAVDAGLVDGECEVGDLLKEALALALAGLPENLGLMAFDPNSLREMKIELYTDAYRALTLGKVESLPESRL